MTLPPYQLYPRGPSPPWAMQPGPRLIHAHSRLESPQPPSPLHLPPSALPVPSRGPSLSTLSVCIPSPPPIHVQQSCHPLSHPLPCMYASHRQAPGHLMLQNPMGVLAALSQRNNGPSAPFFTYICRPPPLSNRPPALTTPASPCTIPHTTSRPINPTPHTLPISSHPHPPFQQ